MIILKWILPIVLLLLGTVAIPLSEYASRWTPQWCALILFFFIYNIIIAKVFKLELQMRTTWGHERLMGFFSGVLFGAIPMTCFWIFNYLGGNPDHLNFVSISWRSTLLILTAAAWKEMWFRGMPLQWASQPYTKIGAALLFGVLTVIIQTRNPEIILTETGLILFLSSYSLCMIYFAYQSLWAAIGFHFTNEFLQSVFALRAEPKSLAYVAPLLSIAIVLTFMTLRKKV